jgi:hypothetical protein
MSSDADTPDDIAGPPTTREVAAGWRHSYQLTPYQNLRALLKLTEADRREYRRVAFKFIAGLGPASTPLALDRLGVGR